jgi:hypothetical protein
VLCITPKSFKRGKRVDTYSQVIEFYLVENTKVPDMIDKSVCPADETFVKNKAEYCFSIVTNPTSKRREKMLTRICKPSFFSR